VFYLKSENKISIVLKPVYTNPIHLYIRINSNLIITLRSRRMIVMYNNISSICNLQWNSFAFVNFDHLDRILHSKINKKY